MESSLSTAVGDTSPKKRRSASADSSDSEFSINSSSSSSSSSRSSNVYNDAKSTATGGRASLTNSGLPKQRASKPPRSKKQRVATSSTLDGSTATAASAAIDTTGDTRNVTKTRKIQQQWTELTAVCHVFSDEVFKYIHPIVEVEADGHHRQAQTSSSLQRRKKKQPPHLSMGEKKQLNTLVERVKDRVDRQSGIVLDNRKLVKAAKAAKCKVRDLRNDIMISRLLRGKLEAEVVSLEKQVRRRKGDKIKGEQASRFLSAIETLAQHR